MHKHPSLPPWTSPWLEDMIAQYEAIAKPSLNGLAIISSATAVLGYASQFDHPDLGVYLRCAALGLALWLIARTFWAGAWALPALETRKPLLIYALVGTIGFFAFAIPSSLGSLSANGGGISLSVTQQSDIDALDNARQDFALYIGEMALTRAALVERAEQAQQAEDDEIAGLGPTGVPGEGSVSRSYAAAADRYQSAAGLVAAALDQANGRIDALEAILAEMRAFQANPEVSGAEAAAQLDVLSGRAIAEMRALLALDPARAVRSAASHVAQGVPPRSQTNAQSQARIAEITADMRVYAGQLETEADRIAALVPNLPQQTTLSPAERLVATMWRTPGLTVAAILFDLCGWIAVGFRLALYQALKAKLREENERPVPSFVMMEDFDKVEVFVNRSEETKKKIEAAKGTRRGRPRSTGPAKASPTKRKPSSTTKPTSTKKPGGKDDV
ncbi:hypothetical protein [Gymnodinialimonas sp.]